MTSQLYTTDILRLAASIPHHNRLKDPTATSEMRSPICGSRIAVDVCLDGEGRVSAIGLQVNACALGQASASLMAAHALGRTAGELADARDSLAAFLEGKRDDPGAWPGLEILSPARSYPARHPAIRLAFEAVADAAGKVGG